MSVADMLVSMGAPDRTAPPAVRWLAGWLHMAEHRLLDRDDLVRIDACEPARGPHDFIASVLPLAGPVWLEATIVAENGTLVTAGYGAVPGRRIVHGAGRGIQFDSHRRKTHGREHAFAVDGFPDDGRGEARP